MVKKSNKNGKAAVIIIVIVLVIVVAIGGLCYFLYSSLIKSGAILNGTYKKDNVTFTIDVTEKTYTLNTNGSEEKGKISDFTLDTTATGKDKDLTYTAKFSGNSTYSVTLELKSSSTPMQLVLKSDKFSSKYVLDSQEDKSDSK